jgi:hypothetical protein
MHIYKYIPNASYTSQQTPIRIRIRYIQRTSRDRAHIVAIVFVQGCTTQTYREVVYMYTNVLYSYRDDKRIVYITLDPDMYTHTIYPAYVERSNTYSSNCIRTGMYYTDVQGGSVYVYGCIILVEGCIIYIYERSDTSSSNCIRIGMYCTYV